MPFTRVEVIGYNVELDLNGFTVTTNPYYSVSGLPITTLVGWTSGSPYQSKLRIVDGTWNNNGTVQIGNPFGGSQQMAEFSVGTDGVVTAQNVFGYSSGLDLLTIDARGSLNVSSSLSNLTVRLHGGALYLPNSVSGISYSGSRSGVVIGNSNSATFTATAVADDLPSFSVAAGKYAFIHSTGSANLGANTQLAGGTITVPGAGSGWGVKLGSGRSISGFGTIAGKFIGDAGSIISPTGGVLTMGSAVSNGFATHGQLNVSNQSVSLVSLGNALLGGHTSILGGNLSAVNGLTLGAGATMVGRGTVDAKFSGNVGSSITASGGNLTVGKAVNSGFFHLGELDTQANTVTILNNTRSTLGSQTSLGSGGNGGTLIVSNGAFVDFGRIITGYGTVDSQNLLSKAMVINGDVIGNSLSERITFEGYVKGVGTFENVIMNGTFSPGLSPTLANTNNLALGNNSILEMEIGGLSAGSQFDKIVDSGLLTFNGSLKLTLINGFNPTLGSSFDLFDWSTLGGSFSSFDFSGAGLAPGLTWDTSNLNSTGTLMVSAVPEPSACAMVGLSLLALVVRRKRNSSASSKTQQLVTF
jgi:PEP-CTERM motif